ncbi:hypothetical protein DET64_103300 [Marinobacter nauticus]|uniref:Uncharacterized protein n=1 Tax=Marinobacter nauticus TaxID=2743 RepID=A0A368V5U1_MARNT|nr:hypothetical protein DET64_103300 [Marinobacter nauticus]RCW36507.1 hypothetical protein DET51_103300 [Marinobacter nauticus]
METSLIRVVIKFVQMGLGLDRVRMDRVRGLIYLQKEISHLRLFISHREQHGHFNEKS